MGDPYNTNLAAWSGSAQSGGAETRVGEWVVRAMALARMAAALGVIAARPDPESRCPDCADVAERALAALRDAALALPGLRA
jgi:hypothetical protein